jgi:hypothetical protein
VRGTLSPSQTIINKIPSVNILPCCQSLFFGSCYKRIFIDEMFIEDENFFVELYKHNGINYIPPNGLVEEENGVKLMEEEEKKAILK